MFCRYDFLLHLTLCDTYVTHIVTICVIDSFSIWHLGVTGIIANIYIKNLLCALTRFISFNPPITLWYRVSNCDCFIGEGTDGIPRSR